MDHHGWSERRACSAMGLSRSTARYRRRPDRDEEVIALLAELAERFPERGFDKLFQLIRRRGLVWNHKRVWRVYCLMQLNRRRRGKKRVPSREPASLVIPDGVNECWSMDFMGDSLYSGTPFRTFNVIDDQKWGPLLTLRLSNISTGTNQRKSLIGCEIVRLKRGSLHWD